MLQMIAVWQDIFIHRKKKSLCFFSWSAKKFSSQGKKNGRNTDTSLVLSMDMYFLASWVVSSSVIYWSSALELLMAQFRQYKKGSLRNSPAWCSSVTMRHLLYLQQTAMSEALQAALENYWEFAREISYCMQLKCTQSTYLTFYIEIIERGREWLCLLEKYKHLWGSLPIGLSQESD